jgi:Amt family ammonium transporter
MCAQFDPSVALVDATIGLRVTEDDEVQGLDLSQHGEECYSWEVTA